MFRYFHFNTMTTSPRASELINQFSKVYANERCSIYDVFPHWLRLVNTLRSRQHGRHFADDILKGIFLNENVIISIKKSLKFVPKGPINNIPALVQIMAWCWPGDKPLSEAMVGSLLTHICVTRPQWVNTLRPRENGWNFADNNFKCIIKWDSCIHKERFQLSVPFLCWEII